MMLRHLTAFSLRLARLGSALSALAPKVLLGLVLGACGLLVVACGPKDGSLPPLVVGMDLSYPPFEMTAPDGTPTGVSAALAQALADHLGRELRVQNMPFSGLIPALRTGQLDAVISSVTRTEERALAVDFSDPYFRVGLALLASTASPINNAADLNDPARTVVVRTGTTGALWAADNLPLAKILILPRESEALQEVLQGRADAFIYDQLSVLRQATLHPDRARALLTPLQSEAWAIALPKDSGDLRLAVNDFLREFRANGGFDRLADTFLAQEKAAFAAQGVPLAFE